MFKVRHVRIFVLWKRKQCVQGTSCQDICPFGEEKYSVQGTPCKDIWPFGEKQQLKVRHVSILVF